MGFGSIWHWLLVILVLVLLFGSGKISGLMGDLAKGIKSFKKEMSEDGAEPEAEPEPEPEPKVIEHRTEKPAAAEAETGRPGQGAARRDQVQVELTPLPRRAGGSRRKPRQHLPPRSHVRHRLV